MDQKEIISDEESQALRASPSAVGDAIGSVPAAAGQVRDLHADHWERIFADRAPALESIGERMASLLKATGRRFFRSSLDVVAYPVRSVRWGTYARALPAPISLSVLDIRPCGLKGALSLSPDFVFVLTEVFFGGDGKGKRPEELIEFTPVEQRLTRKFVEAVAADLNQAWKPFLDFESSLGKTETNPFFAGIAASSDTVSVARFAYVIGDIEHAFEVVLPAVLVEPLRSLRSAALPGLTASNAEKWRNRLRTDVEGARVSMRAVLAGTEISLRDIAQARPGDVIPTELPANVVLYAGDQPLLEGTFGVFHGRNAVRISKPLNRRVLGEQYG